MATVMSPLHNDQHAMHNNMSKLYTTCGWELNVWTCGWGSCFALPLGQRPKDTARTERKPNTQIQEIQKSKAHAETELRPPSPYTEPPLKRGAGNGQAQFGSRVAHK